MSDIRGFFAPKKRAAPTETPDASPAPKAKRTTPEAAAPLVVAENATPEAPGAEAAQAEEGKEVAALSPAQERRIGWNAAAAEARRRRAEDPEGLVEHLALVDDGWRAALGPQLGMPYFRRLVSFLREEYAAGVVYPPRDEVLAALQLCPLRQVRVVVLGQDPYHGPRQAHGLAFSVSKGVPLPPSLRNIYKELKADLGVDLPRHGCLENWARQGVLLLNTCLTVRKASANSHAKHGWETFTDAIIRKVASECEGVVFLLWGKPAQKKGAIISSQRHVVLKTSHPSPLSATRATKDCEAFIGSKCFSKVNDALRQRGKDPIDWAAL